jgi:quercetin dioxygenase-like cupin family protein
MSQHVYVPDVKTLAPIPDRGILSQTIHNDDNIKVVHFGFATGEELSEHQASMPAILEVVCGDVRLTMGDETFDAGPGAWIHMAANLPHSVYANSPATILLTLLKRG